MEIYLEGDRDADVDRIMEGVRAGATYIEARYPLDADEDYREDVARTALHRARGRYVLETVDEEAVSFGRHMTRFHRWWDALVRA